jgi:hypothetical protein
MSAESSRTRIKIPFDFFLAELPLWRLVVSRPDPSGYMYISFFVHHRVCNGTSGVAFHHSFWDALLQTSVLQASSVLHAPQLDLLPTLEQAHSVPLSPFYIIGEVIKSLRKHKDPECWTGAPISSSPNITCIRLAFLSNSQIAVINQLCRENGVTFTALLTVLIARSLSKCRSEFRHFAMSFRRFTGTSPASP